MSAPLRAPFVWTAIGRGGSIVAFGASTALVSATLPEADLGTFFVVQSVVAFASVFVAAGEGRTATAVFASHSKAAAADVNRQWAPTRRVRLIVGGVFGIVITLVLLAVLRRTGSVNTGRLETAFAVGTALALGWQLVLIEALRARDREAVANLHTGRTGGFITFTTFSALYGALVMVGREPSIGLALCAFLISSIASLLHLLWASRFSAAERASAEQLNSAAIQDPTAVVGAQSMNSALVHVDIFAAGLGLGAPALAIYGLARRLAGLLALPSQVGVLALTPAVAKRALSPNGEGGEPRLRATAGAALVLAVAATIAMLLVPDWILAEFGVADASLFRWIFAILAFGSLANVWSGACGTVLLFSPHRRKLLVHSALSLVGLVALLCMHAWIGGGAVALATVVSVSAIIRFVSLAYLSFRLTGVRTDARLPGRRPRSPNTAPSGRTGRGKR